MLCNCFTPFLHKYPLREETVSELHQTTSDHTKMSRNMGSIASLILVITMFINGADSDVHFVGESIGWSVPSIGSLKYKYWAATQNFQIGDTVVFKWRGNHNVGEVSKDDYDDCTKNDLIGAVLESSPATITLNSNASRYFICTIGNNCEYGQKIAITIRSSSATPSSLSIAAFSASLIAIIIITAAINC